MADHWQSLIGNLAVVALFISTWVQVRFALAGLPRLYRDMAFGLAMGLGAIASMLLTIPLEDAYFDLRSSIVAIAGFFGGPVAGAVSAGLAIAYRAAAVGGPNTIAAAAGIALAALTGIAVSAAARERNPGVRTVVAFAIAVGFGNVVLALVLRHDQQSVPAITFEVGAMNALAAATSAFFIVRHGAVERERDLLRQAFRHSPDLQYVKTPDSRFAAVNVNLARLSGFSKPEDMLGRTEFDLVDAERAKRLVAAERAVLAGGPPIADAEEMFVAPDGSKSWYLTSKVALRDSDGRVIGTAGVTRDVTVRRRLREEAEAARSRLDFVLAGVPDGIAMFDPFGVLVYCNEQYRRMFGRTRDVRLPGRHIEEILRAVAECAEQKGIPPDEEEEWVKSTAATLDAPGDQEIELWDGRWLQIKTRPTADGTALIVVSDISTIKQAEAALRAMTEQLRLLAATDGLTGLVNRRTFDSAFADELARARRGGRPLSVLMADVDRFKAYNDLYGHQAGDEVLKAVGRCLREAIKRPGDVAARYGGEEFVALLPDTDAAGAAALADRFRRALEGIAVPHKTSERGIVTVSVGVSSVTSAALDITAVDLLHRADEALYEAKEQGRDCVVVWGGQQGDMRAAAAG